MRYIENYELREWVKDNLRKTIFQKAHALAIQTGCEILVKLEDKEAIAASQYYASHTLDRVFNSKGLRKKPDDVPVSGDTGLPVSPMVDRAIQSSSSEGSNQTSGHRSVAPNGSSSSSSSSDIANIAERLTNKAALEAAASGDPAVPMQLNFNVDDHFPEANSLLTDGLSTQTTTQQTDDDDPCASTIEQDDGDQQTDLSDITVKVEPPDGTEPPDRDPFEAESNGDNNETAEDEDASFSLDTSSDGAMLGIESSGMDSSMIASMNRDTKFYPVPISPKPYQCAVCQKAFRSVQVLQKHTQTFHMSRPSHGLSIRRGRGGRGRGRGHHFYKPAQQYQHYQFAGTPTQPQRFLCVVCNRVFREAHLLEDHMARSHQLGGRAAPPPSTQSQPPTSQSGFDESFNASGQLMGDLTFPLLEDPSMAGNPPISQPNLEDIPGPSSAMMDVVSIPSSVPLTHSQMTKQYTQAPPSSVNIPFMHPPPPVHRIAASSSAPRPVASSATGSPGTPSRGSNQRFKRSDSLIHDIMSAILLTAGPVTSYVSFSRRGPTSLRTTSKQQWYAAANMLQASNLGTVVTVMNAPRHSTAFVKQRPHIAVQGLAANPNLISVEKYTERYNERIPSCITLNMREKLVEMGLLSAEQANYVSQYNRPEPSTANQSFNL